MITDETVEGVYHTCLEMLEEAKDRLQIEALVNDLDDQKAPDKQKCCELMKLTMKLLGFWPTCFYVVGQQKLFVFQASSSHAYSSAADADKEVQAWHADKCNWMTRFTFYVEDGVPEWVQKKLAAK